MTIIYAAFAIYSTGALVTFIGYCVSDVIWWMEHRPLKLFRPSYIELAWVNTKLSLMWPVGIIYMIFQARN